MPQPEPPSEIVKSDKMGRMRTSAARREHLLDEFEKSRLSGQKFASLAGLKYSTFAVWVADRRRQRLAGHFEATSVRMALAGGPLLILHDTTEFSYERDNPEALGLLREFPVGKAEDGRERRHTTRGILMHSSLEVTLEGLPLGLAAVKFWTRKKFKGCDALKRRINPTRVPIEEKESYRWLENVRQSTALAEHALDCVHIGDRESDIYELFCAAHELETFFLVRTCVDRLAKEGDTTIAQVMKDVPIQGTHRVESRGKDGKPYVAELEIKFQALRA